MFTRSIWWEYPQDDYCDDDDELEIVNESLFDCDMTEEDYMYYLEGRDCI